MYLRPTRPFLGLLPTAQASDVQRYMINGRLASPLQILQIAKTPITAPTTITKTTTYPVRVQPIAPIRYVNEQPRPIATVPKPAPTTAPAANVGTPVPAGFPINQFFVSTDGSVWEFGGGKWFNTGTPYAPPTGTTTTTSTPAASTAANSGSGSAPASTAPVVNVAAPASDYQTIFDWLTQQTLISGYPNWIVAGGLGLAGWWLVSRSKGGR